MKKLAKSELEELVSCNFEYIIESEVVDSGEFESIDSYLTSVVAGADTDDTELVAREFPELFDAVECTLAQFLEASAPKELRGSFEEAYGYVSEVDFESKDGVLVLHYRSILGSGRQVAVPISLPFSATQLAEELSALMKLFW